MRKKDSGTQSTTKTHRRVLGAVAATLLVSAVVIGTGSSPVGAKAKTFTATCVGTDQPTKDALSAFGGSMAAPLTANVEAPQFVEPGQTGVPIKITLSMNLDQSTVDTVAAISPSLKVKNINADVAVSGPTSTTKIAGNPPDITINVEPGQPFSATFPAISGTLDDIGGGGIIKLRSEVMTMAIQLTQGPLTDPLNLKCTTGVTVASIPVKIAGSPDVVQPIESDGPAGESVEFDVLNDHVSNGTTKDGVEMAVDPTTLKIVEGDAQIVDGKVVATYPAAGASADVTFEVCAGTVEIAAADPGQSEIQEIRMFFDPSRQFGKRQLGVRFGFGGAVGTQVAWSAVSAIGNVPFNPNVPDEVEHPNWWSNNVNNFALQNKHEYASASAVQAALESIPTIGAGNVEVTRGDIVHLEGTQMQYRPYTVTYTGELANKSLDQITTSKLYSFLPSELKDTLLALAGGGDDGDGTPPEPLIPPAYLLPDDHTQFDPDADANRETKYFNYVNYQAGLYGENIFTFPQYLETVAYMFAYLGANQSELIDVGAATALLNDLFQPAPEIVTPVQGEDPVAAQTQELCSQAVITLAGTDVGGSTTTSIPGPDSGPDGPEVKAKVSVTG